jgi:Cro/C1-type HTH DNA-binding domain
MNHTVARMTLRELLKRYDIHTIRDLTHKTGLSRQQCWNLWHGQVGVGLETVKLLHECLPEIPLEELIAIDQPSPPKRRQRSSSSKKRRGDERQDPADSGA